MPKKITIKEIAKMADVSIGTVDRVLHNRGRVAESTRDKILKIAQEGNYSSNIYARNLKLNKNFKIAIILPMRNAYWQEVSTGVKAGVDELASMGFSCEEYVMRGQQESVMIDTLDEALLEAPDGLVFGPSLMSLESPLVSKLDASKVPYVFVDANIEGANNLSFIGQDAFKSGVMAGRLLNKDYSNDFLIYVITFNEKDLLNTTVLKRVEGLKSFYSNRPEVQITGINLERDGVDIAALKSMLSETSKPIHILVPNSNAHQLADALQSMRDEIQLRLVGYDLLDKNKICLINGTVDYIIDQKPKEQGDLAIQTLYKHIVLNNQVNKNQYLPIEIVTKENLV